jgi:Asp-tRNA(Asn)/Glu-tRNA(Gln) amidotransferase A subunit family amidase
MASRPGVGSVRQARRAHQPIRVAMVAGDPGADVDPALSEAIRCAATLLEKAGYGVEEVTPPDFGEAGVMFWKVVMTEERGASQEETASSTRPKPSARRRQAYEGSTASNAGSLPQAVTPVVAVGSAQSFRSSRVPLRGPLSCTSTVCFGRGSP